MKLEAQKMKWNYGSSEGKESAWDVGDWVWSLGWRDPLEKGIAAHSSILAWRIPWREESGGLQPMGSQRVGHYWATNTTTQSKNTAVRLWQWLQRRGWIIVQGLWSSGRRRFTRPEANASVGPGDDTREGVGEWGSKRHGHPEVKPAASGAPARASSVS